MTIKILPPQLANQIAAGEVVERPASVVKELVENSLDAGATRIQVDIENGGATLIRIRDNGIGISKDELALALARHATSKITCLEDLETILSLGFRGEALASISSVSRLTLSSKTENQTEAWQVYAQGRDMETTIQPTSHPVGTTVEVANLFFNTPARRKFLRTEKTEFTHIDEVIRRIALAKPNIAFTLTHNGKILRQYRNATNQTQEQKRLSAICGEDFVKHALRIDWKHNDLHLYGWVTTPSFKRNQNDLNYSYINGRMVKDKVINHAIRQAYAEYLSQDEYPAFVIFIDLNPNEVDVNVHPTKHEVRFHQARLIHDFIYQGISNALNHQQLDFYNNNQTESTVSDKIAEPIAQWSTSSTNKPNRAAAGENIFSHNRVNTPNNQSGKAYFQSQYHQDLPTKIEKQAYTDLIQNNKIQQPIEQTLQTQATPLVIQKNEQPQVQSSMLQTLALIENKALLLQQNQQFYLLSIKKLQQLKIELSLCVNPTQQPLLMPIMFHLDDNQYQQWQVQQPLFQTLGFEFNENQKQHRITLMAVPTCLRSQNLQKLITYILTKNITKTSELLTALSEAIELDDILIFADAINLLTEVEQRINQQNNIQLNTLLIPINWQNYLEKL
ncbi:DNA mismatch repair protein MutL [Bisgaardia hudsonensis]|uniref:DNA mismatch repair protein MutL n=1 Tax=Bisgaardia hudsonensis TaxID=109472 RepID=A0A4R2N2U1_9PAST|nr:DNA mismatch repair endonuclease MutL [Bisgaardia hudsonensis]QLB12593.1 DNA mismatch repair protein MutL [Bisgaardia hudsonensis]TCP14135.1 DNA mismatch repair protein MutL [Bisgaardia hudsonensis]